MSENVAYLGGTPTAQYPDAGIVPFCMLEDTPPAGGYSTYPIDCTTTELCELYWRVKTWRVTWDVTVISGGETTNHVGSEDVSQRAKGLFPYNPATDYVTPTKETELSCPLAWFYDNGNLTAPDGVGLQLGMFELGITKHVGASMYRPNFGLLMSFAKFVGAGVHLIGLSSTRVGLPLDGTFDLIANEKTYSVGYELEDNYGGGASVTVNELKVEAIEWWPYAQLSDGLDVYDTTSGDVLVGRDPFG